MILLRVNFVANSPTEEQKLGKVSKLNYLGVEGGGRFCWCQLADRGAVVVSAFVAGPADRCGSVPSIRVVALLSAQVLQSPITVRSTGQPFSVSLRHSPQDSRSKTQRCELTFAFRRLFRL